MGLRDQPFESGGAKIFVPAQILFAAIFFLQPQALFILWEPMSDFFNIRDRVFFAEIEKYFKIKSVNMCCFAGQNNLFRYKCGLRSMREKTVPDLRPKNYVPK